MVSFIAGDPLIAGAWIATIAVDPRRARDQQR
jgi:hypothetical protein